MKHVRTDNEYCEDGKHKGTRWLTMLYFEDYYACMWCGEELEIGKEKQE